MFMQAMLATTLNDLVTSDPPAIDKCSYIKLSAYSCNILQNRRILICIAVEPLTIRPKVGDPKSVDSVEGHVLLGGQDVAMKDAGASAAPVGRGGSNAGSTSAARRGGGGGSGGGAGKMGGAPIYPIEGLSPYQNKWTIKARVTNKSDIRHWSNARGDGKLFSVNLLDETGEIKATGFNEACDNLYPLFEEGKVYYISKARVNIAKKQYSNLSSEYEIMFENSTEVTLCEDQESAPKIQYNFIQLADLAVQEKDATCDVLGIVKSNGDVSEITAKASQKQIKKRELTIVDQSGYEVKVTLWGKQAESWVESDNGVFAFKAAKVGDFGGRTLSMGGQSTLAADPDIPEAHNLRGWYDVEGKDTSFKSYTSSGGGGSAAGGTFRPNEFATLDVVKERENTLADEGRTDYFNVRATIMLIKPENMSYPACPTEKCNKKVSVEGDGMWRCEKCDQTYEAPEYRYVLNFRISDQTNTIWASAFNDVATQLLGETADALHELHDENESAFTATIARASGVMYNFACRAKAESYNDVTRVKYHALRAAPVNWVECATALLEKIKIYQG